MSFTFLLYFQAQSQSLTDPYPYSQQRENRFLLSTEFSSLATQYNGQLGASTRIGFEKYLSDEKKQRLLTLDFSTSKLFFARSGDFSPLLLSLSAAYKQKIFFRKFYFIEYEARATLTDPFLNERTQFSPFVKLSGGKGRIDRVNEKFLSESLMATLAMSNISLDEEQVIQTSQLIRAMKNKRKFLNLGSIAKELALLTEYLGDNYITNDHLSDAVNRSLVKSIYKYYPSLDRLAGRTINFGVHASTIYRHFPGDDFFDLWRIFGQVGLSLAYREHDYINRKFQLNKIASISTTWLENYDRGYGISENLSLEAVYYPNISSQFSFLAGMYNRFHTLSYFNSYGLELGLGLKKIFSQRCYVELSSNLQLDFNQRAVARAQLAVNI